MPNLILGPTFTPDNKKSLLSEPYLHPVTAHGRAASLARIDRWIESTLANLALAMEPFFAEDGSVPTPQQKKQVTTLRRVLSRLHQEKEHLLARPLISTGQP